MATTLRLNDLQCYRVWIAQVPSRTAEWRQSGWSSGHRANCKWGPTRAFSGIIAKRRDWVRTSTSPMDDPLWGNCGDEAEGGTCWDRLIRKLPNDDKPPFCPLYVTFCVLSLLESHSSSQCHPHSSIYLASWTYSRIISRIIICETFPDSQRSILSSSVCLMHRVYTGHCCVYHIAPFPP